MIGKIIKILVIVVACVMIGALALNILLPNAATTLVNAVEDMVFKGTGMAFDFNGDGDAGDNSSSTYSGDNSDDTGTGSGGGDTVEGFE